MNTANFFESGQLLSFGLTASGLAYSNWTQAVSASRVSVGDKYHGGDLLSHYLEAISTVCTKIFVQASTQQGISILSAANRGAKAGLGIRPTPRLLPEAVCMTSKQRL